MPRTSSAASKSENELEPSWAHPGLREPRYSQSLERGLAILGCFTPKRPVLGIADIADELGMSRSTTHRYVITLVALAYLEQGAPYTTSLGVLDGTDILYVDRVRSFRRGQANVGLDIHTGSRLPAYATSMGK